MLRISSLPLQDLPRTFPSNDWVATEEGQAALGRVLLAFSVHKPQIGYCQGMNYITATLLLALERNEENTFWLLVSLIDDGGRFISLELEHAVLSLPSLNLRQQKNQDLLCPLKFW